MLSNCTPHRWMEPVPTFFFYLGKKLDAPFPGAHFFLRKRTRQALTLGRPDRGFAGAWQWALEWGGERPQHPHHTQGSCLSSCCRELLSPGNRVRKECQEPTLPHRGKWQRGRNALCQLPLSSPACGGGQASPSSHPLPAPANPKPPSQKNSEIILKQNPVVAPSSPQTTSTPSPPQRTSLSPRTPGRPSGTPGAQGGKAAGASLSAT